MKRAKRKALLALLRRRTFVHEQLTPELAEKLVGVFSVPDTVLSYGSKHFSKELIDDLSAVRPQLVGLYKEQINDNGAMLSKDFFKPETHVHELGLRCMEVAGMLPKGGLAASKEDFDAFFENKPVEMLNDPANNGW